MGGFSIYSVSEGAVRLPVYVNTPPTWKRKKVTLYICNSGTLYFVRKHYNSQSITVSHLCCLSSVSNTEASLLT